MSLWQTLSETFKGAFEFAAPGWATARIRYQSEAAELRMQEQSQRLELEQLQRLDELHRKFADQLSEHWSSTNPDNRQQADMWLKSELSTNTALEQGLKAMRNNADELYRTFPYITGAIDHRTDNVIGQGLKPKSKIGDVPGIDRDQLDLWDAELNALFNRWAPCCGARGRTSWTQTLRMLVREWKRAGDAFLVRSHVPRPDKPIPLQLDVISARRCDSPPKGDNPRIRMGIELDGSGEVTKYHFSRIEPGDTYDQQKWEFIPAERVSHLLDELWPDQLRGVPWSFAVQGDAKDYDTYRKATMFAAQIHACQTLIVRTANPALAAQASATGGTMEFKPGKVMFVDHKDDVTAFNPTQPTTSFSQFGETQLLGMASGLNYPFGWFVRDRRRSTFSAGKLEEIDGMGPLRSDFQLLKDRVITPIWKELVQLAVLSGQTSIPPALYNAHRPLFEQYLLTPSGRPWIDPQKEVTAEILAIEHNLDTMSASHHRRGLETDEVMKTRSREKACEWDLDIVAPIFRGTLPTDDPDEIDGQPEEDV